MLCVISINTYNSGKLREIKLFSHFNSAAFNIIRFSDLTLYLELYLIQVFYKNQTICLLELVCKIRFKIWLFYF